MAGKNGSAVNETNTNNVPDDGMAVDQSAIVPKHNGEGAVNSGDDDLEDLMDMEVPIPANRPLIIKLEKPAVDTKWDHDAICRVLDLSVKSHDTGVPFSWKSEDPEDDARQWKPKPLALPQWIRNPVNNGNPQS